MTRALGLLALGLGAVTAPGLARAQREIAKWGEVVREAGLKAD